MDGVSFQGVKGRRLSYANVMSTVAVFIALGGVSWAAISIPRNSVGPAQLKRGAVDSVRVKDKSLLAKDIKPGQVFSSKAWSATDEQADIPGAAFVEVASVTVPKGTYAASVSTSLVRETASPTAICQLVGSNASVGSGTLAQSITLFNAAGSTSIRPFSLTAVIKMLGPGQIKLLCNASGGTISAYQTSLTAVGVQSATMTSG